MGSRVICVSRIQNRPCHTLRLASGSTPLPVYDTISCLSRRISESVMIVILVLGLRVYLLVGLRT
ncbi:hypothetical protein BD311DRAFT_752105 [Dichomitus squalens]|uniref:Uncharacterized protein n=1 Tax=Dichomitus squalens TaxID=114155 RepID=A0A4Q9MXX8_9APHY|nr:hypothetical protein BD311DRAFT_752105 [Dichomitus squalens]